MAGRKGSGRTKGATSCVKVTLRELNRVLREDASVIINRRYAETLSLNCDNFKSTTENIQAVASQIDIQAEDLAQNATVQFQPEDW